MGDDPRRSSGGRRPASGPLRRLSPVSALLAATIAVIVAALLYVLVVDDPLGGEPVAVAPIQSPAPTGSATGEEKPDPPELAMRAALDATTPEQTAPDFPIAPADIVIREADEMAAPRTDDENALVEPSRHGPLPTIARDGRRPAQVYAAAAPAVDADTPRIAVLVGGMGLSVTLTEDAIRRLPAAVTLAFAPYGREIERLTARARRDGHELMVQVPLEPYDYPDSDPGPHTLLTGLSAEQNRDRLHWVMSRFSGYVGATNHMGGRFTASEQALRPFLGELRERGLIYVDDAASPRSIAGEVAGNLALPFLAADVVVDAVPTRAAIADALAELEEIALERGRAVAFVTGLPAGIDEIADWIPTLEAQGIALVPVTALLEGEET